MIATHGKPHRVVIVGGGFAGLFAARALGRSQCDVKLLDSRNFHTFQPLLYQVATGALTTGDIATPHRLVLRDCHNVEVLMSEARDLDPVQRRLIHAHGELAYDSLVIATGVQHSYFGQDRWGPFAPGLKTLEHALEMRRRIFRALELAEMEPSPQRRQALMTFVVVGAGPTGVELAGALAELTMRHMHGDFRRINPRHCRILLVEGADDVLPSMAPPLRGAARKSLVKLGVTVMTGTKVDDIGPGYVRLCGTHACERIDSETILWAAGVTASRFGVLAAQRLGASTDRAGRMQVTTNFSLPKHPDVFVIGDLAHCEDATGRTVPGLAPAAIQSGEYVARELLARLRGKRQSAFRYKDRGSMAVIGRNHAVGDLRWLKVSGFIAWLMWALVHVWSLIQPEKRARVFLQWAWRYFSRETGDRLITGDLPPSMPSRTPGPATSETR